MCMGNEAVGYIQLCESAAVCFNSEIVPKSRQVSFLCGISCARCLNTNLWLILCQPHLLSSNSLFSLVLALQVNIGLTVC